MPETGQPGAENPYAFQPGELDKWHAEKATTPADSPESPESGKPEERHEEGEVPPEKGDGKTAVEPKPTIEPAPEGEVKPKVEPDLDLETLPPEVKEEILRLRSVEAEFVPVKTKLTEAEKALGSQGRELGAARKAVEEKAVAHESALQNTDTQFRAHRLEKRNEKIDAEDEARSLRDQARYAATPEEEAQFRKQADLKQDEADGLGNYLIRLDSQYGIWRTGLQQDFAGQMEEALFSQFPELKEVKGQFDEFCRDFDMDPIKLKTGSIDKLYKAYKKCLAAYRGSDEAMTKIKEGSEKLAREVGARKRGGSGPGSGSSNRDTGKEPVEGWADKHFTKKSKRSDPEAT